MRSWWDLNVLHYYVIERHLGPWGRSLRRQYTALTGRIHTWREAWALRHGPQTKERHMTETETPAVDPVAKGRLLLASVDAETAQALRAALTAELLDVCKAEAVHEARRQLEAEFVDQREQLYDTLAREKQQIERDAAAAADADAAKQLALDEQDFTDRLDTLRTKARQALARAQAAEACVVQLITELVGVVEGTPVWLYSGGQGLRTLDKGVINRILGPGGVVLKSKATVSERKVRVTLDDGQTVEHTLFWLAKTTPAGVLDPDDEDDAGTT